MILDWQSDGLQKALLFSDLDDDQIEVICRRCQWIQCDPGQQIIGQSDMTTDVFFVINGSVRAKSFSLTGREVSFIDISSGALFGEFSAIDGQARSSSIVSLSPCTLARMTARDFRLSLGDFPSAALKLIDLLVAKTRLLNDRVFEFSTLSVKNRINIELLRLAEQTENDGKVVIIKPAPTHHELATRISTHREAVTRELNVLVAEKIITVRRGQIDVIDLPKLKLLVSTALDA